MTKYKWSLNLRKQAIEDRIAKARIVKSWGFIWSLFIIVAFISFIYLAWQSYNEQSNQLSFQENNIYIFILWIGLLGFLYKLKDYVVSFRKSSPINEAIKKSKGIVKIDKFFAAESLDIINQAELKIKRDKRQSIWQSFYVLRELLESKEGQMIILRLGVDPKTLLKKLKQFLTNGNLVQVKSPEFLKNIIFKSFEHAAKSDKHYVNPDDVFWALSSIPSHAQDFLLDSGIKEKELAGISRWLHVSRTLARSRELGRGFELSRAKAWRNQLWTSTVTPLLDSAGRDLTAEVNTYYPLVAREEELKKIYELIETGTPGILLTGLKGVGITKLIEGLAQKIVTNEVPPGLADRRVHTLSLGRILALSSRQNSIKAVSQELAKEIKRSGNIVLVLEDLPALEAVKTEDTAIVLEQLLVDALKSKKLVLIATAESKALDFSASSLINSLQQIEVKPFDNKATLEVLETMAPYLELEYKVLLTYQALERTVELSQYLHDLAQPAQSTQLLRQICGEFAKQDSQTWITAELVERVVSERAHLPLNQVTKQESSILVNLETLIHEKYVNQKEAVVAVAAALRRARTQLKDKQRPIGSFLFLGPTGVGKTELARRLAEIYFKSRDRMIRLDMSEYQERQALRNLIGAPPGTGSREDGLLIKAIKENPFSVILLDELEKAHPDILNIFLQVMEDGRVTSSHGETFDFSHSIIIGTSNAGALFVQKALETGLSMEEIDEALKKRELLQSFKPEFLNRFDSIVVFKPLSFDNVLIIAKLLLHELEDQLAEQGYLFEATPEAIVSLAKAGFNPAQGARPLRRVIQDRIEDQIAKLILNKNIKQRDKIILKKDFVIEVEEAKHY